jgi:hypothetical protein
MFHVKHCPPPHGGTTARRRLWQPTTPTIRRPSAWAISAAPTTAGRAGQHRRAAGWGGADRCCRGLVRDSSRAGPPHPPPDSPLDCRPSPTCVRSPRRAPLQSSQGIDVSRETSSSPGCRYDGGRPPLVPPAEPHRRAHPRANSPFDGSSQGAQASAMCRLRRGPLQGVVPS